MERRGGEGEEGRGGEGRGGEGRGGEGRGEVSLDSSTHQVFVAVPHAFQF